MGKKSQNLLPGGKLTSMFFHDYFVLRRKISFLCKQGFKNLERNVKQQVKVETLRPKKTLSKLNPPKLPWDLNKSSLEKSTRGSPGHSELMSKLTEAVLFARRTSGIFKKTERQRQL